MDSECMPDNDRRSFLRAMGGVLALGSLGFPFGGSGDADKPLNVLFITADDLHCDSLACYGGAVKDLTPNLDRLASQGMRFEQAHVNIGICMPSRIALATGLYGHNSGAMGFMHARAGTPNVVSLLQQQGYAAGVLGKLNHSTACEEVVWDYAVNRQDLGDGRNPDRYAEYCRTFLKDCRQADKPFYLMVNTHDPHRPFQRPHKPVRGAAMPSRLYKPDEVPVPGFLPDLPGVREELSYYLNSTKRMDDTIGAVLKVLDDSGAAGNTLVMFISDNGIATPFAKCNCYLASTRTPWIVRWPGVVKSGTVNSDAFISGIDFLPTVLEATKSPRLQKQDGRSFLPLLKGDSQKQREWVFTQIDSKYGNSFVPMRCVQNKKYGYIFNAWASNGHTTYHNANEGLTMKAMEEAAKDDPAIAGRVAMFRKRTLEELYDLEKDPDCLNNLIDNKQYSEVKEQLYKRLEHYMESSQDPLLPAFRRRYDKAAVRKALRVARRSGSGIRPLKQETVKRKNQ